MLIVYLFFQKIFTGGIGGEKGGSVVWDRNKRCPLREEGERVLYAGRSIRGVITEDHCSNCGAPAVFSEEYVACCCLVCNEWLEGNCGNPDCDICLRRPATPFPPDVFSG